MRTSLLLALSTTAALSLLVSQRAGAQYTPIFYDGYEVSADTMNLNFETGARQSGVLAPIEYVAITPDVTNGFQHQMFSAATSAPQPLQLAESGTNTAPPPVFGFKTMVSPDYNFKGTTGSGIVGKRISFDMDIGAIVVGSPTYIKGGITIGGHTTLLDNENERSAVGAGPDGPYFSMNFVEDTFSGLGSFLQFWDGIDIVGNVIANPAGAGNASVQIDATDPADGNPWDGVGSTVINVSINGTDVFSYSKPDGGYADNFITLFAGRNLVGNQLATTLVDNFTVFAAPAVIVAENADFDSDLDVDGADFLTWQRGVGTSTGAMLADGDANGNGAIDAADLATWRSQFTTAAVPAVNSIPEPPTVLLGSLVGLVCCAVKRGRR
jgi:hypothetical protein